MNRWLIRLSLVLVGIALPFRVALAAVGPCPHAWAGGVVSTVSHAHHAGSQDAAAGHHAPGAPALWPARASAHAAGDERSGIGAVQPDAVDGSDSDASPCTSCVKSCGAASLIVRAASTAAHQPIPPDLVPFAELRIPTRPYLPLDRPPLV